MGKEGPQGKPSGSQDERPPGCVVPVDTEHRPANIGDDVTDGGSGIAGKTTLGVVRANGPP